METIFLGAILLIFTIIAIQLTLFIYWLMRVSGVELPQIKGFWQKPPKVKKEKVKRELPLEQFVPDPKKKVSIVFEETDEGHGFAEVEEGDNV